MAEDAGMAEADAAFDSLISEPSESDAAPSGNGLTLADAKAAYAKIQTFKGMKTEDALDALAGSALALPPPWGEIAALIAKGAAEVTKEIRGYAAEVIKQAAVYIPAQVQDKFAAKAEAMGGDLLAEAAKDWVARWAHDHDLASALNKLGSFNAYVYYRLSDTIYQWALDCDLSQGLAACAGAGAAYTQGSESHYHDFLNIAAAEAGTPDSNNGGSIAVAFPILYQRWAQDQVDAATGQTTASLSPEAKVAIGVAVAAAAAGVVWTL